MNHFYSLCSHKYNPYLYINAFAIVLFLTSQYIHVTSKKFINEFVGAIYEFIEIFRIDKARRNIKNSA